MSLDAQKLVEPKLLCPHCWAEFYSDEATYISRHPEYGHADEVVVGPKRFKLAETTTDSSFRILDPKGWELVERACPRCHLQLAPDLLRKKPFIISVAGPPKSGKTYFLTSMIHCLRQELVKYFGYDLKDADSHFGEVFKGYESDLFHGSDSNSLVLLKKTEEGGEWYNRVRFDGAEIQLPKPFIFSLRPTEANLDVSQLGAHLRQTLVLYDNAGESFEFGKDVGHDWATLHLKKCSALLFAFDPLQDRVTRERLAGKCSDPQVADATTDCRQELVLDEVINRMRRHRGRSDDDRLDTALAVCVQKYDVWKSLLPGTASGQSGYRAVDSIDHTSIEFVREKGIAGLDTGEINAISLLVRAFVSDVCPEFVARAESNFASVRYFPVSALGTSPQREAGQPHLKVRRADIAPFRVTHPLLWLMYREKLIRRVRSNPRAAGKYPHAQIQSIDRDRLRILNPYTQTPMVLDTGYAGSTVIDPTTGERFWIPELPTMKLEKPESTAPVPPPSAPLTLNAAPSATKKGWFGKK